MLRRLFFFLVRCLLALRYRVRIDTKSTGTLEKGCLILPNHPAYTDPILVLAHLWPCYQPAPLAFESYYRNWLIHPFMRLVKALEVPDLESASHQAKERIQENLIRLIASLKAGNNHVIWPSGHLQKNGMENLGSTTAVHEILKNHPEAPIVLVRTSGLWGSRFSLAYHGRYPALFWELLKGAFFLILNLIFLMPRRNIVIEVVKIPTGLIPPGDKLAVNRYLENWFNQQGAPEPVFRPYHFLCFWRKRVFPSMKKPAAKGGHELDSKLLVEIQAIMDEHLPSRISLNDFPLEAELASMGMDSIGRMEVLLALEQRFGFTAPTVPETLGELYSLCSGTQTRKVKIQIPKGWSRGPGSVARPGFLGETILECFLNRVRYSGKQIALVDDLSGAMTYRKLLISALVVSQKVPRDGGVYLGILLPASAGAMISYFAVLLAGKIPVLLNWTTGPGNLNHAVQLLETKYVVTARRFIDRIGVQISDVSWLFLEDIGKQTSWWGKMCCVWQAFKKPEKLLAQLGIASNPADVAAVLFTSGSEKAPKAVPLTHQNILSNQKTGAPTLGLTPEDSFLAFLPPFHSFGLCITGIMPLLMGMRVAFHPDPTDAHALLEKLENYEITLLVGTPTFVSHILERAKGRKLDKIRLIVTGAEKCPEAVFQKAKICAPNALVLEGYGITECSPVVSGNTPGNIRAGSVGKPLPGVEVRVVNPETHEQVSAGELGMLYISGPTIFPGYLGPDPPNPFQELEGRLWYISGDLVTQDSDGYIFFKGRLKRFMKVGGEMVSLPALEEPFTRQFPGDDQGPMVAVEGWQNETVRCIALFSRIPLEAHEANQILQKAGFRGVCRIDRVIRLENIPILGTGKTNYRALQEMLKSHLG